MAEFLVRTCDLLAAAAGRASTFVLMGGVSQPGWKTKPVVKSATACSPTLIYAELSSIPTGKAHHPPAQNTG